MHQNYKEQVDLLLRILPYIAKEPNVALKGGTAINMFEYDMPRLSVDIDLTYLGFEDRSLALSNISNIIKKLGNNISNAIPNIKINFLSNTDQQEEKLLCTLNKAQVKIEINRIMRGSIKPPRLMALSAEVQKQFGKFAEALVISYGELFGGKICAALDRQHPRDLFDVHCLLNNKGFTTEVKYGFIAALLSSGQPIHHILAPELHNQEKAFKAKFEGMNILPFTYADFESTRYKLIDIIHTAFNENDKRFILSFKAGNPDWELIDIEQLQNLPAIQWKLSNIKKLAKENTAKHKDSLDKLYKALYS